MGARDSVWTCLRRTVSGPDRSEWEPRSSSYRASATSESSYMAKTTKAATQTIEGASATTELDKIKDPRTAVRTEPVVRSCSPLPMAIACRGNIAGAVVLALEATSLRCAEAATRSVLGRTPPASGQQRRRDDPCVHILTHIIGRTKGAGSFTERSTARRWYCLQSPPAHQRGFEPHRAEPGVETQ